MLPAIKKKEKSTSEEGAKSEEDESGNEVPERKSTKTSQSPMPKSKISGSPSGHAPPRRSKSPINSFRPLSPSTRRPYTTMGKIAQVFDVSYVQERGGEGWRQTTRRTKSTEDGKDSSYWKHKQMKTMKVTPKARTDSSRFDNLEIQDPPPHLEHWFDLKNPVELIEFIRSYTQDYKTKHPKLWSERDVFSFVADSFQDAVQVDASGKELPEQQAKNYRVDFRLDVLVLRHRISYEKMMLWGINKTAKHLKLDHERVTEMVKGIAVLGNVEHTDFEPDEDLEDASAAVLAARKDARDIATVEAFMIAEMNLRRERARLAEVKNRLQPMEQRLEGQIKDMKSIEEHLARSAAREAQRAQTALPHVRSRSVEKPEMTNAQKHLRRRSAEKLSRSRSRSRSRTPSRPSTAASVLRELSWEPSPHSSRRGSLSSRDALLIMRKGLSTDVTHKKAAVQVLSARAEEIEQGLRAKEEAALVSRDQMRHMEWERSLNSSQRKKEEAEKEALLRASKLMQLEEGDRMMERAEEKLEELSTCDDMESRYKVLEAARRAFEDARGLYVAADKLDLRVRRVNAVEHLLDLEFSKRSDGDTHLRLAYRHLDSIGIDEVTGLPKDVPEDQRVARTQKENETSIKYAKAEIKKARAAYERTGALEDAIKDVHRLEDFLNKAIEHINRKEPEEEVVVTAGAEEKKKEEEEEEPVVNNEVEPEQQALFQSRLNELIEFKKQEAMATLTDSLYGMQAWLYRARRRPSTAATPSKLPAPPTTPADTRPTSREAMQLAAEAEVFRPEEAEAFIMSAPALAATAEGSGADKSIF